VLVPGNGPPDVYIRYGSVPTTIEQATVQERIFEAKQNQLLFRIDGVVRYLISNGNEIVVERLSVRHDEAIQLLLLGSAFGALMHQRGLLPLHGSAIETSRGVVVFAGYTGIGKSTLASAFHVRGYRIFTDDVCVVSRSSNGVPLAHAGYPEIKITAETADRLGVDTDALHSIEWWKEKYMVSVRDRFSPDPQPLYTVYWLTESDAETIRLTPVEGMEKFEALVVNTYWKTFMRGLGTGVNHFKLATAVAQHARIIRVTRPRNRFLLDELVEKLEQDFL
jgi:hypothetical protein